MHFAKKNGTKDIGANNDDQLRIEASSVTASTSAKRGLESGSKDEVASGTADEGNEDPEAKRRRLILEEAREIDADSERSDSDSSDEYVEKNTPLARDVLIT